jgi:hypothetical protein
MYFMSVDVRKETQEQSLSGKQEQYKKLALQAKQQGRNQYI